MGQGLTEGLFLPGPQLLTSDTLKYLLRIRENPASSPLQWSVGVARVPGCSDKGALSLPHVPGGPAPFRTPAPEVAAATSGAEGWE